MATTSKTSTFEVPKFSQSFSALRFRRVLPAGLAVGPRLPRRRTAAFGSRMGPRFGGRTAPRGQGRHGCGGQRRPWPRTRIWGEGTPSWVNGIFTWGRGWNVEGSSYFRCFTILWKVFCQNLWHWYFVLFFVIPTILFRHLQLDCLWIDDFSLEIERRVNHSPNCPNYSEFPERPF